MCGRVALFTPPADLAFLLGVDVANDGALPRYNIAPTQRLMCVLSDQGAPRRVEFLFWGIESGGGRSGRRSPQLINARIETAAEKPTFRNAYHAHRCIIPVTGFYEWGPRPDGGKQPHFFHLPGYAPFCLAGLWFKGRDGAAARCVVLTQGAYGPLVGIHDRAPVTVDCCQLDSWLSGGAPPAPPRPLETLTSVSVGSGVNSVRNDDASLIAVVAKADSPVSSQLSLF